MNDLEHQLRTTFTEIATHDTPDPDLTTRLIANARSGAHTVVPFRRPRRFTAPLLAAAVVLLLAAGILVATRFNTTSPPVAPPPAPTGPSVPATGSPTTSVSTSGLTADPSVPTWVTGTVRTATGLPAGLTPRSTQFVDRTTGFLLGSGPCATGSEQCGGLYRTQDGGASWTQLSTLTEVAGGRNGGVSCPVGNPDLNTCAQTMHFSDARHGVLSGESVALVTDDGGDSWRAITWPAQTSRSVVQVGSDVYALDYDLTDGSSELFRADGSGFTPLTGSGTPRAPRYVTASTDRLFVVSTSTDGADSLASTTDGVTWRPEPAPPCRSAAFEARVDGTLVLTCLTDPSGAVLADGARSWTQFSGAPVDLGGPDSLARITAVSDARHFAVLVERGSLDSGSRYVWGVTSDGGTTWETVESDVRFPSAEDGGRLLSVGDGTLAAALTTERLLVSSTDLGLTWTARGLR